MTAKYHTNLFWSEPDGAWVADVPDLRSCSAFGDSPARRWPRSRRRWRPGSRSHGRMGCRSLNPVNTIRGAPPRVEHPRRICSMSNEGMHTITATAAGPGELHVRRSTVIRLTGRPNMPFWIYQWG